jgi:hypothetical protein
LTYDFIVAPGADPDQIRLTFEGASDIQVADSGDLLLATDLGDVRIQKPVVYQLDQDGHKTLVAGHYIVERQTADVRSASNPQSSVLSTRYVKGHPNLPSSGHQKFPTRVKWSPPFPPVGQAPLSVSP